MKFDTVEAYVVYLRYKRSGSALLVNLLDAHPNVVFVRNEELFGTWERWKTEGPHRLFQHLYSNSRRYHRKPFSANGYSYPIRGVGEIEVPMVIGHKSSTRRMKELSESPARFRAFKEYVGVPLKFVHLVRSPYDQVNARWQQKEWRRKSAPVMPLIKHVEEQLRVNTTMRAYAESYYQIHYEDLVADPKKEMRGLLSFLGVPVLDDHLENCVGLVRVVPHAVMPEWREEERSFVQKMINDYPEFLGRYEDESQHW